MFSWLFTTFYLKQGHEEMFFFLIKSQSYGALDWWFLNIAGKQSGWGMSNLASTLPRPLAVLLYSIVYNTLGRIILHVYCRIYLWMLVCQMHSHLFNGIFYDFVPLSSKINKELVCIPCGVTYKMNGILSLPKYCWNLFLLCLFHKYFFLNGYPSTII